MTIPIIPVPPITDLSSPQNVARLMNYLRDLSAMQMQVSDNNVAPSTPTAIAVRQGAGKTVEISVTFTEPADWGTTELYRNTTDNSATATLIDSKKAHTFHDTNVSYGSTYYYWAKVIGMSATAVNTSGFSPSSGHSITVQQVLTADVADSNITTAKINDLGVTTAKVAAANITTAKRQAVNSQSLQQSCTQDTITTFTFTVATGSANQVTARLVSADASSKLSMFVRVSSSTSVTVLVWNFHTASVTVDIAIDYW